MSTFSPSRGTLVRYAVSAQVGKLRSLLVSPTGFLVTTTSLGYAFGYLYLVFMGRALGPQAFGVLGSLVAIFYIACLVGQALREAIASNLAEKRALHGEAAAIATFKKLGLRIALLCLLPTLGLIAASGQIASFFHLTSVTPVLILAFAVFTAMLLDVILGLLQGLQLFRGLGIAGYAVSQGLKLTFGLVFVWAGWSLNGAIGALLASTAIAVGVGLLYARKHLAVRDGEGDYRSNLGSVVAPALILAVFMAMPTSVDVMLVTHFFDATDAGLYNAVATLGKVVMFLPMAVSFVLLPQVVERHTLGLDTRKILLQSLVYALALSGVVTATYVLASEPIVTLFFGAEYADASSLVAWYGLAMILFALNFVLVHYGLAVRDVPLMLLAAAITLLQVVVMALVHQSLFQIILILLFGNVLILACSLLFLATSRRF